MSRKNKLSAEVCITVNGETISMLTIDEGGHVEYLVSEEEIIKYDNMMLENIAKTEAEFYRKNNIS